MAMINNEIVAGKQ